MVLQAQALARGLYGAPLGSIPDQEHLGRHPVPPQPLQDLQELEDVLLRAEHRGQADQVAAGRIAERRLGLSPLHRADGPGSGPGLCRWGSSAWRLARRPHRSQARR